MKRRKRGQTIKQQQSNRQIENKKQMIKLGPTISITTLNVNGLNTQIKRIILSDWILKRNNYVVYKRSTLNTHYKGRLGGSFI